MRPEIFDRRAYCFPDDDVPVYEPWVHVSLDPDYAGAWIIAADLDNDGQVELVAARNNRERDAHEVTAVAAFKLDGTVLWRWGPPGAGSAVIGYDVACQIHDWDNDGAKEVIFTTADRLVVLDGATGKEKFGFPAPEESSDCLSFADLSGSGYPSEAILKNRYHQIWAFDIQGRELWTCRNPAGKMTAHQVHAVDIDRDGRDELIVGYAMLNSDGSTRWNMTGDGVDKFTDTMGCHLDCARVVTEANDPVDWRIAISCCANERLAMLNGIGETVWAIDNLHFESIDVCNLCPDIPGKQLVIDVGAFIPPHCLIWVVHEDGTLLGKLFVHGSRFHFPIDWLGTGQDYMLIGGERSMFNGKGEKMGIFKLPGELGDPDNDEICARGDMTGNGVPDVVFSADSGHEVYIFRNENGAASAPGLPQLTKLNYTFY